MSTMIIVFLMTIFLPSAQLSRPALKLTFTPDEKYISYQQQVEIRCELINPNQRTDSAQLWYVDLKTGSRTAVSRSLLISPTDDAPEIFKNIRNKRYEYLHKNSIRIRALQMEDSARYECDCPDCQEPLAKQSRDLLIMQLREPEWRIESGWPLHENTKAVVKCFVNDFYPYVSHRILRDNKELTNVGKSTLSSDKAFPQTFVWEATITPTAEWHNSTLRCSVTEGNTQQETAKILDVLFSARFLQCEERQYVDVKKDQSTIECAYSGNPAPKLLWLRQSDQKPITVDNGITTSTRDEGNGRYRSIVTFDRNRLNAISINGQEPSSTGESYYQQLLNNGFLIKLTVNGNEKATRMITIVRHANQMHLPIVRRSYQIISKNLIRTYRYQTKVFGYNAQLQSISNIEEMQMNLRDYNRARQANPHAALILDAYRKHGHRLAKIDPLGMMNSTSIPELDSKDFFMDFDVKNESDARALLGWEKEQSIGLRKDDWIRQLNEIYCQAISLECEHIENDIERLWIARRFEQLRSSSSLSSDLQQRITKQMRRCEAFDQFLQAKFPTLKRYSGEGAEGMLAFFDLAFQQSVQSNIENVIVCMPHRGRNNLLVCLLNYPAATMFRKIKGKREFPADVKSTGDVLSHLYSSTDLTYDGKTLHVSLIPNPSHLEANNPVAVGKARACQLSLKDGHYNDGENAGRHGDKVLCIQVHGDASFAGQGIIAETFQLSHLPNYSVGGSIHLVTNNQIGYTTPQHLARSSNYCTDFGKIVNCPVIHVNGLCPQEISQATQLACEYRDVFRKDIIVDLVCFRKHGHNELDDPSFTQPSMYRKVQEFYQKEANVDEEIEKNIQNFRKELEEQFARADQYQPKAPHLERQWSGMIQAKSTRSQWNTGLDANLLKYIGMKSVDIPQEFQLHSTIARSHVQKRQQRIEAGTGLDWSTGEALALGSLLLQNFNIRISGQDVGRGTFSQRHGMLVNQKTDDVYIPLNALDGKQGFFEICNSILSEEAVLGFDYGFSIHDPKNLVIWEAQFGDFFNGAQIIIDTYISGGELKFLNQSGIVLLLPHGMDGAGPEHSSCHVERFLQMTDSKEDGIDGDDINMQVVNPTTPAQYFHLLRRQMIRNFRKPLIVAAPKILLRHPDCVSTLSDMADGTSFQPVLLDNISKTKLQPEKIKRILFTSGKHYFTLNEEREKRKRDDVVIIRLEELCPFPADELRKEMKKYPNAKEFLWCQEEHRNQGAWSFINPRFQNIVGVHLKYAGREVLGTPAVAIGEVHQQECARILKLAFD